MQLTRRTFAAGSLLAASGIAASRRAYLVYIGTYTGANSQGIYAFRTGGDKVSPVGLVGEIENPSFLAISSDGKHVYSVGETNEGTVSAFSLDRGSGKLSKLNTVSSKGSGPCFVTIDGTGKHVLVANYGSGSVAVLPIQANGSLGEASSHIQHTGSGVNPKRQKGPHAHCVKLSADNRFALVSDLGLDKVLIYKFDAKAGKLTPNEPAFGQLKGGTGPRHFAFHPKLPKMYVIGEMGNTVTVFDWNAAKGQMTEVSSVSTLPAGYSGNTSTAEIIAHPNGRFVYGSNRGHDSISVFSVGSDGGLTLVENAPTKGHTPRNFALDPSGTVLWAANQDSGNIVLFNVDSKTGKLTPTGEELKVGSPVCVRFLPV